MGRSLIFIPVYSCLFKVFFLIIHFSFCSVLGLTYSPSLVSDRLSFTYLTLFLLVLGFGLALYFSLKTCAGLKNDPTQKRIKHDTA